MEAYHRVTENYEKPKIFIATPCYSGQVSSKYMHSMCDLIKTLIENDIRYDVTTIQSSLIPRSRNTFVTRFMKDYDSTHLLFIDADIQFKSSDVLKMLREDKDVICGCYPKHEIHLQYKDCNLPQNEWLQTVFKYGFVIDSKHKSTDTFVEMLSAPTGFMLIKKQVFRNLIRQYPETEYISDSVTTDICFNLFQSQVVDHEYLSEDKGFCRLWRNMGGTIIADLTIQLNKVGPFCYYGYPLLYFNMAGEFTPDK